MLVNVNRIYNVVGVANNNINNYENMIYDTISTLKNMKYSWNDGYTNSFFRNVDKQVNYIGSIIDEMKDILKIIRYISNSYSNLSRYIPNYNGIINSDNYNIHVEDYEESIKNLNIQVNINNIEDSIASFIAREKSSNINMITYNNLDRVDEKNDFIGMKDDMKDQIKMFDIKKNNSKVAADNVINSLFFDMSIYNSSNYHRLKGLIDHLSYDVNTINSSLDNAYNYIINREREIKKMVNDLENDVNQIRYNR